MKKLLENLHYFCRKNAAFKIALIYVGLSLCWILFSDKLLFYLIKNSELLTTAQTLKGGFFVIITAAIIFFLLQKEITKLKKKEDILRSTLESTPDGILVISTEGRILDSNNRFAEMWSIPQDMLLGTSDYEVIKHTLNQIEDPEGLYRQIHKLYKQGLYGQIEELYKNDPSELVEINLKDGRVFERHTKPLTQENTQIGRVWCYHDLTEEKLTLKKLQESEKNYRTLFDSAADAILILNGSDIKCVDCNLKSIEMFSREKEDIIGKTLFDLSPPKQSDGKGSQEKAQEIISSLDLHDSMTFEWQLMRLNGEVFESEVSLSIFSIGSEKYIQGIVRDITERKRLDKENRLLQRWVEHSVDLFFWVGEDSQILYVNRSVCNSLGYTVAELCNKKVGDIDLEITPEVWPDFTRKLRKQRSLCFESRLCKKNGQVLPVEITANILEFEGQDHFFAYGRDISGKIKAEKNQKDMEKQLAQAQKMEAIGTLAGGIAHDFNNVLSSILGYTNMVLEDLPAESQAAKDLQQVTQAGNRATDLVKQILTFSRQTDQELQPLRVQLVIKEALKLLRSSIPTTIEFKQNIDPNCEAVLADPTQVHQIIMNLCTNAYHAMRETGGVLCVSLQPVDLMTEDLEGKIDLKPGSYVKLEISDTGRGITKGHLEKIFEPYFTTKAKGEGTGLGLAVVHGIVMRLGGDIAVYSEPDKGTIFHIYLPVIKEAKEVILEEDTGPLPTGNERILLVDDDEALVLLHKKMLESLGYTVTALVSSTDTLEIFKKTPNDFDLVISDFTMPNLTGTDIAKQMLAIRPALPIILCTGFSEMINEEKVKDIGIRGYVMKPVNKKDLAKAVRKVLAAP